MPCEDFFLYRPDDIIIRPDEITNSSRRNNLIHPDDIIISPYDFMCSPIR